MADRKYSNYGEMVRGEVSLDGLIQGLKRMLPDQRTLPEPLPKSSPLLTDLAQPRVQTGRPLPTANMYKVQRGDSLSAIAKRAGISLDALLEMNPSFKAKPGLIKPGQSINLGQANMQQRKASPKPVTPAAATPLVTTTGPFPTDVDTLPLPNLTEGVGAQEPMQLNVVDNRTPLEVVRPAVERTIGQAGAGFDVMGGSPLGMADEDFINTPRDAFIAGRSVNPVQYKNKNAQEIADFMAKNPDVSKITAADAKRLAKLSGAFRGSANKDGESDAILNQFRNWSGMRIID